MLERERDIVGPHLEHRRRSGGVPCHVAEPGIEEARVMGTKLAARRIVGSHLRSVVRWHADPLPRDEQVELAGVEDEPAVLGLHAIPVVRDLIRLDAIELQERAAPSSPVPGERLPFSGQVDAQEQPVGDDRAIARP